jgi:hypothetical protein
MAGAMLFFLCSKWWRSRFSPEPSSSLPFLAAGLAAAPDLTLLAADSAALRTDGAAGFAAAAAGFATGAAGFGAAGFAAAGAAGLGAGAAAGLAAGTDAGTGLGALASALGAAPCTSPTSTTPPHLGHFALAAVNVAGTLNDAAHCVHLA